MLRGVRCGAHRARVQGGAAGAREAPGRGRAAAMARRERPAVERSRVSPLSLSEARAEFYAARCHPVDLNGGSAGFIALCPACVGEITASLSETGGVEIVCSN